MLKPLILAVGAVLFVVLLASLTVSILSEPGSATDGTRVAERNGGELVHLPDGTSVMCVFNGAQGIDCDWAGRK